MSPCSRRSFFTRAAAALAAIAAPRSVRSQGAESSRVIFLSDGRAWTGPGWTDADLDRTRLGEMIGRAVMELTGATSAAGGFRALIPALADGQQRIGIKVNCVNEDLPSHPAVAGALIEQLLAAGATAERLLVFDRLSADLADCGYPPNDGPGVQVFGTDHPSAGYDDEALILTEGSIRLSRIISQGVDHLINLPVLKNHEMTGVTGALKNHFGSIDRPMALHGPTRECSPGIAEVNAQAAIRQKTRLVLVDACFATYQAGLAARPEFAPMGLIAATDPVAADAVGLQIVNARRLAAGLKPLSVRHLADAEALGLGRAHEAGIDRRDLSLAPVHEKPGPGAGRASSGCATTAGGGALVLGVAGLALAAAGRTRRPNERKQRKKF